MFKRKKQPVATSVRRPGADLQRPSTSYYRSAPAAPKPVVKRRRGPRISKTARRIIYLVVLLAIAKMAFVTSTSVSALYTGGSETNVDLGLTEAVQDYIQTKGFASRVQFMITPKEIANALKEREDIEKVEVKAGFLTGAREVILTKRESRFAVKGGNTIAGVNDRGVVSKVFGPSDMIASDLIPVEDKAGLSMTAGSRVMSVDTATFIRKIQFLAKDRALPKASFVLPLALRQIDLKLDGDPLVYKMSLDQTAEVQFAALLDVKEYLAAHSITPAEYVDLRLASKAYYK